MAALPPHRPSELPALRFANQDEWAGWLEGHHAAAAGVWLQLAKRASGLESVTYDEAVEVALCYGWIDGQKKSLDSEWWLQKFTRRGPKSLWSEVNTVKAQKLIEEGRMKPAGLQAVEHAQQDGRWAAAYAPQSAAVVPDDLQAALAGNPEALAFFATLDSRNRYALLFRIHSARRPETRAKRIEQFVLMLADHKKLYP